MRISFDQVVRCGSFRFLKQTLTRFYFVPPYLAKKSYPQLFANIKLLIYIF